jgi:hypothetical protein
MPQNGQQQPQNKKTRMKQINHKNYIITMFPHGTLTSFNKSLSDHRKEHHEKVQYHGEGEDMTGIRMVWDIFRTVPHNPVDNCYFDGVEAEYEMDKPESMKDFIKLATDWIDRRGDDMPKEYELGLDVYPHTEEFMVQGNDVFSTQSETSYAWWGVYCKIEKLPEAFSAEESHEAHLEEKELDAEEEAAEATWIDTIFKHGSDEEIEQMREIIKNCEIRKRLEEKGEYEVMDSDEMAYCDLTARYLTNLNKMTAECRQTGEKFTIETRLLNENMKRQQIAYKLVSEEVKNA